MEKINIDQVENTNITLETILGLAQTTNDLIQDEITLLTKYPSDDNGKRYRADRLATKLLALSAATIEATKKAQIQIDVATHDLMKVGGKQCN